jgi:hypothetical protein
MRVFLSDLTFSAMAARSQLNPARWRRRFWPLLDGIEAGWAIPLLLTGFVAVWIAYLVIAYLVGDLHFDVLEAWILGRNFAWGSSKHPPLMGWVAHAWKLVFPPTDWSLLALVSAGMALWAVDLISRRFVRRQKNSRAAAFDGTADLSAVRATLQCQRGSARRLAHRHLLLLAVI